MLITAVPPPASAGASNEKFALQIVLALGGRKGDRNVAEFTSTRNNREDVITVALTLRDGEFDEKGKALVSLLLYTSSKGVSVVKHPVKK